MAGLLQNLDHGTSGIPNFSEELQIEQSARPKKKMIQLSSLFKGILLSFLSGVMFSLLSVMVKYMKNIHPGQLALYAFTSVLVFSLPQAVKTGENLLGPRKLRFLIVLRGIMSATCGFLNFIAFRYLPLGEAAVIVFSFPVFVTVAARIFLKESCGIVSTASTLFTVVGLVFITRVPVVFSGRTVIYTTEHIYGLSAAFASTIFMTSMFIITRKVKEVHHSVMLFNQAWAAILTTAILTSITGHFSLHHCGGEQQVLLILIGVVCYMSLTFITMALQLENAGPSAAVRAAADIILSFLWQTFLFKNPPDAMSITGVFLVGISVVLVSVRKWVMSLPSESQTAKKLKFLTA